jgi:hypothetical protein
MSEKQRQQLSKEFGIKLAQALKQRAAAAAPTNDLDARFVLIGAAEYLKKMADGSAEDLLDPGDLSGRDN